MRIAPCPYFGTCGGCSHQDMDYAEQIDHKREEVSGATGVAIDDIKVFSADEFRYRNRMDFIFTDKGLGLKAKGRWWQSIDIEYCMISDERLNQLLQELRGYFDGVDEFDSVENKGTFMYAVIRTPRLSSSISFVLNKESPHLEEAEEIIRNFDTSAENVIITHMDPRSNDSKGSDYHVVKGGDMLVEEYLGTRLKFSVQGFFQNNSDMAEKLHSYVRQLLQDSTGELLDLYGGVGAFGILNSDNFDKVTIVESVKECIGAADHNIRLNDKHNIETRLMDARYLRKLKFSEPLTVITDPPRSGMHPKTIKRLNEVFPEKIIYVSCNVKRLYSELKEFKDYRISSVTMFDLFPQTSHVETVVELEKDIDWSY